jgi:hypothetical protein
MASAFLLSLSCATVLAGGVSAAPAGADQVGSLKAQAKTISEELVQEQLEAGAYQQQYSVASAQVARDERAIASLQVEITADRHEVTQRLRLVQRLAIESYVLNGSVSSGSGAALFAENVSTVQSANEYATISIGNLNEAVEGLRTAKRNEQSQQQTLVRQRTLDQSTQVHQASYLAQANASVQQMQTVQAKVTGQLAVAVAQQNAALSRAALAAVTAARKATVQKATVQRSGNTSSSSTSSNGVTPPATSTVDPALPPFLACVVQAESGGDYQAVSPGGLYMGAFQFSQSTWNFAAQEAHRPDLVGVPPNQASKADQDTLAVTLFALDGERPWLGDRCSA